LSEFSLWVHGRAAAVPQFVATINPDDPRNLEALVAYASSSSTTANHLLPPLARIIEVFGSHCSSISSDVIIGGLAALMMQLIHNSRITYPKLRETLVDLIYCYLQKLEPGNIRTCIAWLWDMLQTQDHTIPSVGNAVLSLVRHNEILIGNHISSRTTIGLAEDYLRNLLNSFTQDPLDIGETIGLANSVAEIYKSMYRCAHIVGQYRYSTRSTWEELNQFHQFLTQFDSDILELAQKRRIDGGSRGLATHALECLGTLNAVWFSVNSRIASLIREFTCDVSCIALEAYSDFRAKHVFNVSIDDIRMTNEKKYRVLCPAELLRQLFEHWLLNIWQRQDKSIECKIKWKVECLPRNMLTISMANTGTPPLAIKVELNGLREIRERIREFGGDLGLDPHNSYSCVAWVRLIVW
jgi:hypothetical protein